MNENTKHNDQPLKAVAKHHGARISPKKLRFIVKELNLRKFGLQQIINHLAHSPKKGSALLLAVIKSAIANAENNHNMDIDELKITRLSIDKGHVMKRMMPRARGRGDRIIKRTSHIKIGRASCRERV